MLLLGCGTPLLALQSINHSAKLLNLFLELEMLPSEVNISHENDGLNSHEGREVDSKDNSARTEEHGWMVVDGFGNVNQRQPSPGPPIQPLGVGAKAAFSNSKAKA